MAGNRRRPTKFERDALRAWIELAKSQNADPTLRSIAHEICRLVFARSIPAKQAAAQATAAAGLTGRAIADFRAEQRALQTEMMFTFNRGQPIPQKSTIVAGSIAEVGERQVYKRLKRSR